MARLKTALAVSAGGVVFKIVEDRIEVALCGRISNGLWGLPKGTPNRGEDLLHTALREVREETGYRPGSLVEILGFYSAPGFCTEHLWVYLATDLVAERAEADADEQIELVRVPVAGCVQLIRSGEIRDAKSIAGLLAVQAGWGQSASAR